MEKSYSASYAAAGVDITAGYRSVELMKQYVARTMTENCIGGLGGFGGLFELDCTGIEHPVLISGTDGVGTKLRIASPPMTDPCFYGVDTSTREELISARKNTAGVCEEIGADSLVFLSPESLLKAGSRKELCMACFTGQYPTALYQSPEEANKDVKC